MLIQIENEKLTALLNTEGGYIEKLFSKTAGKDYIWQYDAAYWPRRTSICFPIMSILKNDQTIIDGVTYHMENHGFLREMNFEAVSSDAGSVTMRTHSDDTTRQRYPYDFRFDITYHLAGNSLLVDYAVTNDGSVPMYYGLGVHTTYKVPVDEADRMPEDLYLQFPEKETAGVHIVKDGLQTRNYRSLLENTDELPLENAFDDGALIFDTADLKSRRVSICSRNTPCKTTVDFTGWPHIAFWAKPGNMPFLCIEPMTSLADREDTDGQFLSKPDLTTVQPGESINYRYTITVE